MAKDDFDVIAYKILAYAYACLKQGVAASTDKACEVAKVNEVYFFAVLESLIDGKLAAAPATARAIIPCLSVLR